MTPNGHPDAGEPDRAAVGDPEGQLTHSAGASSHGDAPRLRLHPAIEPFFASDGNVYLLRAGAAAEHVIRQPDAIERRLLTRLAREGVSATACSGELASLAPLIDAGVAVPEPAVQRLAGTDAQRFARQLPYLQDHGDPVEAQRRLRASTVAVLGCGGLGTWALGALAGVGVGRFVLIDDDDVELSNLNRQILYRARDIGRPKVKCAAEWVAEFDPDIEVRALRQRVRGPDDLLSPLAGCDAVLLLADWPPYELSRWVNEVCVAEGIPFTAGGQQPPLLKIGPTHIPGHGACHACHERQVRRDFPLYDELAAHRRAHQSPMTTLAPASGIVATFLALEMLHLLLGHRPLATHDRVLLMDMRTLHGRWEPIAKDPDCRHCSRPDREA